MKKTVCLFLALSMLLALAACAKQNAPAVQTEEKTFRVGICQLVQHPALDAATQGFRDRLTELLGERVTFDEQNAQGDSAICTTICNQFVADKVDLILANATPALQAAASATSAIPILGTSITDYATALDLTDFQGATGLNVSGTSDLAPLDQQAAMISELFPEAKKVGILYCSSEPNSFYQAGVVRSHLEAAGIACTDYTFADSNDIASVVTTACGAEDVLYIPTDNKAADNVELIRNVVVPANMPVVAGEEGICSGCGVATLTISYYDIGKAAGEMAYRILAEDADISSMEIGFAPEVTKKYNADICASLGISIPEDYAAIG